MTTAPYIPQKTLEELNGSHPKGTRHEAMIKIAMSLLGNGFSQQAVFAEIRSKFDAEKTDKEILDVISWCSDRNPTPSGFGVNGGSRQRTGNKNPVVPIVAPKKTIPEIESEAKSLCLDFVGHDLLSVDDVVSRSKVQIGELNTHAATLFSSIYAPEDELNIVCDYTLREDGKASPKGGGKTLKRDEWVEWFNTKGTPYRDAGAWLRPNPCGPGSGGNGAICDKDIKKLEFMLIESDFLPLEVQLSLYFKWKLPVAVVLLSGGDSAHALVRLRSPDEEKYAATVKRVLEALKPFGFDQSNKNPSRLSRLPGAIRKIGAKNGRAEQRLLFVDPSVEPLTDEALAEFEKQVTPPFISESPLRVIGKAAVNRYEELHVNRGKTGVLTGFKDFDKDTGGLKRGTMIVLAAETNAGKSTAALNIVNHAINDGKTCALFTLEMDREEVFDLLLCMNLKLNRNIFNTGEFTEGDMHKIAVGIGRVSRLPLYIFDDPSQTVEDIEAACLKLMEKNLQLIVVDYLQLVMPPPFFKDSREQQIAYIGRSLRMLAKKCKAPVIAVSQLNEEGKIRESRAVGHDAHIVFMLEWKTDGLQMRVAKGRSIQKKTYPIYFDAQHCIMLDGSKVKGEDVPMPRSWND